MKNMAYYFAYGSNMNEGQMKERMESNKGRCSAFPKGKYALINGGRLRNWELKFNKEPTNPRYPNEGFANIVPKHDYNVEGVVYEIDEKGLARLDCSEGVPDNYFRPINRLSIEIEGNIFMCEVYIAVKIKENLRPSGEYINHLLKGKEHLSKNYYEWLLKIETTD
jgi:gamma-glutamylcyclotransferase (GGCT)/AIG2-like uncharacterized protein YtfP